MSSHTIEDLTSCILDFQANVIRVIYRKKTTLVDPNVETSHATMLRQIWAAGRLTESPDENGNNLKWRQLGFDSENLNREFGEVGVLGLDCLVCGVDLSCS
jgi:engulfment/cell motility protein 1